MIQTLRSAYKIYFRYFDMPGKELERRAHLNTRNALPTNFVDSSRRVNIRQEAVVAETQVEVTNKGRGKLFKFTMLWLATFFASGACTYADYRLQRDLWRYTDPQARVIKLYSQTDDRWNTGISPIWKADATCGPTFTAMLLSTYGEDITPPQVDAIFAQKGFRKSADAGTLFRGDPQGKDVLNWLTKEKGFQAITLSDTAFGRPEQKKFDFNKAQQLLDEGYYIVASADVNWIKKDRGWSNHIFGIVDVDPEMRSFRVFDPWDGTIKKRHITQLNGQFFHYTIALKKKS